MTPFSLIARGDRGGLGSQLTELHRHLRPAKTLVMDLADQGRGPTSLKPFTHGQIRVNVGARISDANLKWLLEDVAVLFTVECDYRGPRDATLWDEARKAGVRTILQANPELKKPRYDPDVTIVPTTWEQSRLPGSIHLPMPVATDRLPYRQRIKATTFVHYAAPAAHDRNGTELVIEAVRLMHEPCRLVLRGPVPRRLPRMNSPVQIEIDTGSCPNYWDCWPDADILILPRRYGGLSLPMQEAAALGIPTLTFGIPPQQDWPGTIGIRAAADQQVQLAGGQFPLYTCRPNVLARKIDQLVNQPHQVAAASTAAGAWARTISWDVLAPRYEQLIADTAQEAAA